MDQKEALEIVKKHLTEKRYIHTLGVMESAKELAVRNDVDVSKAELAAIFHDYAKFRPKSEMEDIIKEQRMASDLLHYHHELWHAPVGAYLVEKEVGITDQEVLQAITNHTTGKADMSLLDKVIFLADYIEPGRKFPGVDHVRELAKENLDKAVIQALKNTIQFLMDKSQPVYPDTFNTYNAMMMKK